MDARRDGRVHGRAVLRDAVDVLARGHEQDRVYAGERLDHAARVRVPGDDGDVRLRQRVVAQAGRAGGVAHHEALRRALGGEPERELRPQETARARHGDPPRPRPDHHLLTVDVGVVGRSVT